MTGEDLRKGLGGYVHRGNQLAHNGLTLHDLGELIRRAGLAAGFVVESEFKCEVLGDGGNRRKIDWVWFTTEDRTTPLVAIEIEGRDVDESSLDADRAKFECCGASVCALVLFQVDRDLSPKGLPSFGADPIGRAKQILGLPHVEVVLDSELMAARGIEGLQQRARQALVERRGKR